MKYKDLQNKVHDIDPAFAHMLPVGCVQINDTEASALLAPTPPTLAETNARHNAPILAQLSAADVKIMRSVIDGDTVRINAHKLSQAALRSQLL